MTDWAADPPASSSKRPVLVDDNNYQMGQLIETTKRQLADAVEILNLGQEISRRAPSVEQARPFIEQYQRALSVMVAYSERTTKAFDQSLHQEQGQESQQELKRQRRA